MTEHKIDFTAIEWESPLKGVRFKKFRSQNKQIRFAEYTKDFIEPEWCLKGHIGYVIDGEFEINFNGNIVFYKTGDNIFIPSGEDHKHKLTVISSFVKVFLVEEFSAQTPKGEK